MSRLGALIARVAHQPVTVAYINQLKANSDYLTVAGADLASAAAIHPTSEFHGITGTTTIDTITDDLGPAAGQQVRLWIKGGPLTIRNNGGGTGNIRTLTGADRAAKTNEVIELAYDGTVWREQSPASAMTLLMDYTAPTAVASIDTNTILGGVIPQGYTSLRIESELRDTGAGNNVNGQLLVNNDATAADYYSQQTVLLNGVSTASTAYGTQAFFIGDIPGSTAGTQMGSQIIEIPQYSTALKHNLFIRNVNLGDGSANSVVRIIYATRNAADAITRLAWFAPITAFAAGCRVTIWGMK